MFKINGKRPKKIECDKINSLIVLLFDSCKKATHVQSIVHAIREKFLKIDLEFDGIYNISLPNCFHIFPYFLDDIEFELAADEIATALAQRKVDRQYAMPI